MNQVSHNRSTRLALVGLGLVALLALASCGNDDDAAGPTAPATEAPEATEATAASPATRTVEHVLGTTEIPAAPERIVSASVTMTGHLLGVDAPVVATMTTTPSRLADGDGFFVQWGDVARERNVEPIAGMEINAEAIAAAEPDLIVGSAVGGDAVNEDAYALLSDIAPTIVYDHSGSSWQELTTVLGSALGLEEQAKTAIAEFAALADDVGAGVDATHEVAAMTVTPDGLNVFTSESAHGKLLTDLGYTYRVAVDELGEASTFEGGARGDIVSVSIEQAGNVLGDSTLFFVFADQTAAEEYAGMPAFGSLAGFGESRAHPLGFESFRLDRYSATDVAERIASLGG